MIRKHTNAMKYGVNICIYSPNEIYTKNIHFNLFIIFNHLSRYYLARGKQIITK